MEFDANDCVVTFMGRELGTWARDTVFYAVEWPFEPAPVPAMDDVDDE